MTASLFLSNGCALLLVGGAAAAGAGTVYYMDGEQRDTEQSSLDAVHTATLAGLNELGFAVVNDAKDTISSKILVRTASDTKNYDHPHQAIAKQSRKFASASTHTFGDE